MSFICIRALHLASLWSRGLSQLGNSPYWWRLICLLHCSAHSNLQLALCFLLKATPIKRLTKIIFDSKQSRVFKNWSIWAATRQPPFPHLFRPFKIEVFCCFLQAAWTATQHCMEGMGEEKLYFLLLKSIKRPKGPLGQTVSANFVADCGSSPPNPVGLNAKNWTVKWRKWIKTFFKNVSTFLSVAINCYVM